MTKEQKQQMSFCRRNGLAGEMAVAAKTQVSGCRECGRLLQQTEGDEAPCSVATGAE